MKILRKIKSGWTAIMGFATWVLVVVSSFMMEPPQRSYFEENNSPEVSKFIIAALTAILLVQILRRSRKKEYKYWYRISIGSLIFGLAIFSCYKFMADRFSVNFYDTKIVTGDTMFPSMKHRKDSLELAKKIHITDSDFVKMCQGKV